MNEEFEVIITFVPDARGILRVVPDEQDIAVQEEALEDQKARLEQQFEVEEDQEKAQIYRNMMAEAEDRIERVKARREELMEDPKAVEVAYDCTPYGYMERLLLEEKYKTTDQQTGQVFVNSHLLEGKLLSLHVHRELGGKMTRQLKPSDVEKFSGSIAQRLWREIKDRSDLSGDAFFRAARRCRPRSDDGRTERGAAEDHAADSAGA